MTTQKRTGRARVHLMISGRVQGVGFRFAACDQAENLALAGWVRNVLGGEVEIVAEGLRENLEMLVAWARRGPRSAHVTDVRAEWDDFSGEFTQFRIR